MRASRLGLAVTLLCCGAASASELTVSADPLWIQLGTQPGAQVQIAGPTDLSGLSLSVNHGTIGAPRQTGPGRFVADYRAPGQTFPRVAIIVAAGASKGAPVHGWTPLPLWGSAEAVLQTVPNANVSVRIGDRTYGPIRADAQGIGRVPVVVPPGVQAGFYGTKVLDLGLPRVSLTHLALDPAVLPADREQAVVVRFFAVTQSGRPREGLALQARASRGTLTAFQPQSPGVYSARWTLPITTPGDAELSVWAPADPHSTTAAKLRLVAGPAARLELAADSARILAGTREVSLSARVTDARGYPAGGVPAFTSTLGVVGRAEPAGDGAWIATLGIPRSFGPQRSLGVRAELEGAPAAQVTLALQPGPAQRLRVEPSQLSVVSDGTSRAELVVELIDAEGNTVEGAVNAAASVGELTMAPTREGLRLEYLPPRSLRSSTAELSVSSGTLSARVPVLLAAARSKVTFGVRAGLLTNLGNANAFASALELKVWLGRSMGVGLEAGYLFVHRQSVVGTGAQQGARVLVRAHAVPVLATVSWRARLGDVLKFRATAAGGVVAISSNLKLQDQQTVSEGSLVPSAQLAAGVGYDLGAAAPFVEVGVRWVGEGRGNNLTGSLFSVSLSAGCRFDLL